MNIREAEKNDLHGLLELYVQLHDNPMPRMNPSLSAHWSRIVQDENHHIIMAEIDDKIVSSCVLIVVQLAAGDHQRRSLVRTIRLRDIRISVLVT